jgi:hypothetical protein
MENVNNPVEETKIDAPAEIVEAPKAEEVTPEPAKVEEAPKAEEAPKTPDAIGTYNLARSTQEVQAVGPVSNGAIGTTTAPKPTPREKAPAAKKDTNETVAIHSSKNVTWEGVGKVYRGYNIVSKEAAEKWLTRPHTRLATPEEVAAEFGK